MQLNFYLPANLIDADDQSNVKEPEPHSEISSEMNSGQYSYYSGKLFKSLFRLLLASAIAAAITFLVICQHSIFSYALGSNSCNHFNPSNCGI